MTKWKVGPKYRGWLKLHCLVDIDTNEIIAWVLTEEKFGDTVAFPLLTELAFNAGHGIGEIYADAAYHGVENWKDTVEHGVAFVVRFLSSTVPKSNGCMARGRAAVEWCSMPYNEWVEKSGYGLRWKIECTFSDFKRVISECIDATSQDGMVRESRPWRSTSTRASEPRFCKSLATELWSVNYATEYGIPRPLNNGTTFYFKSCARPRNEGTSVSDRTCTAMGCRGGAPEV